MGTFGKIDKSVPGFFFENFSKLLNCGTVRFDERNRRAFGWDGRPRLNSCNLCLIHLHKFRVHVPCVAYPRGFTRARMVFNRLLLACCATTARKTCARFKGTRPASLKNHTLQTLLLQQVRSHLPKCNHLWHCLCVTTPYRRDHGGFRPDARSQTTRTLNLSRNCPRMFSVRTMFVC
jgi:hypothetical protein